MQERIDDFIDKTHLDTYSTEDVGKKKHLIGDNIVSSSHLSNNNLFLLHAAIRQIFLNDKISIGYIYSAIRHLLSHEMEWFFLPL